MPSTLLPKREPDSNFLSDDTEGWDVMTRAVRVTLLTLAAATVACGSNGSTSTPTATSVTTAPSPTETPVSPLVGEWEQVTTCDEFIQAFRQAGFEESVIEEHVLPGLAGPDNGWLPAGQLADPKHPCEGAQPREHSHFFTEFGTFGSLDYNGQQVDDGTYEIINNRTFQIGNTTFHYRIIGGDKIMFEPVIPDDCSTERCLEAALWSVSVAYAGEAWERVS
jgi:hypothetical protein